MSADLFACVFWLEENQYSVVPATDIVEGSTVEEGDEAVVAWRFAKKNKVHTSWYKAKIIKYSENEQSLSLLCDELGEEKENAALKQPRQRKKTPKAQALMQSDCEYSGSNTNASSTAAPASKGRKRKSSDENGDKQSTAANSTRSPTKPSSGNKSSRKSADVEAAQLRAKTFFDSVTVDLSSGTDEPPVSANTTSDPEGNRVEPSSRANRTGEIEVLSVLNKDTSHSSQASRTPLSRPLHSNQHATTPQVRKESTSRSTSAIKSPSTNSTPVTKGTPLIPLGNNYHIPISPIYHHESPVTHQSNSYVDLLCDDEDSSTHGQNLSTLLSSAIRQSYDVESPNSSKASANSCPNCALYKARNEELEARLNELEDKCQFLLSAPAQVMGFLDNLTEFLNTSNTVHVNEFEVDQMIKRPRPVQRSLDMCQTKTTKPVAQPEKSHFDGGEGKQELCPNSGVFISTIKLKAIHHKAGYDLRILFHELVDFFFTEEVLARSIAFGTRSVPAEKEILNPDIVSAIQAYLLACARSLNVPPIEPSKLRKMFTNKCTTAKAKRRKQLLPLQ